MDYNTYRTMYTTHTQVLPGFMDSPNYKKRFPLRSIAASRGSVRYGVTKEVARV